MKPEITFKFNANNMFLKNIYILFLLFFCVTLPSSASTLSGEEFKEYAPEQAYWVVSVTCDDSDIPRVIQRKTDGNQWCGKDIEGFCFDTKAEAGNKVCGEEFDNVIETKQQINQEQERQAQARVKAQQAANARVEAARQQATEDRRQAQIQVDRQLLEIEQEKLALRQQELKLQKRAVEIREALDELDN